MQDRQCIIAAQALIDSELFEEAIVNADTLPKVREHELFEVIERFVLRILRRAKVLTY